MTADDIEEFNGYLYTLTLNQVFGVLAKEIEAGRMEYAALARAELKRRGAQ